MNHIKSLLEISYKVFILKLFTMILKHNWRVHFSWQPVNHHQNALRPQWRVWIRTDFWKMSSKTVSEMKQPPNIKPLVTIEEGISFFGNQDSKKQRFRGFLLFYFHSTKSQYTDWIGNPKHRYVTFFLWKSLSNFILVPYFSQQPNA